MTHARRGNYALLFTVALLTVLGFGALALDTAYMLMARSQVQGVADAASHAAMVVLRQTGDQALARDAAARVVAANRVAGGPALVTDLTFGSWDDASPNPAFQPTRVRPNAVRVTAAREGEHAISFLLARIWGYDTFGVHAHATCAARSTQVILVTDITGSWGERDFAGGRAAVLTALDLLSATASDVDEVGMAIFTNRYAWEYTPLTDIAIPANADAVRATWRVLNIASKGGRDVNHEDGADCALKPLAQRDDFTNPAGGCYPDSPREYTDEPGTDHSTGILLAQRMFEERPGEAAYRAMIVLTDGRPNDLGATSGQIRAAQGYVETRWREYLGPVPRTKDQIRSASITATEELWDNQRVSTWAVSLVEHDWFMPAMVRGDGYYIRTDDSGELASIFAQIISEMPLAIVE